MRPSRPRVSIPEGALMPCVVQHADTGRVLMLAYMNLEALQQTLARRRAVFFSRSKQRLWISGSQDGGNRERGQLGELGGKQAFQDVADSGHVGGDASQDEQREAELGG